MYGGRGHNVGESCSYESSLTSRGRLRAAAVLSHSAKRPFMAYADTRQHHGEVSSQDLIEDAVQCTSRVSRVWVHVGMDTYGGGPGSVVFDSLLDGEVRYSGGPGSLVSGSILGGKVRDSSGPGSLVAGSMLDGKLRCGGDPGSLVARSTLDGEVRYSGGPGSGESGSTCLRDAKTLP